MNPAPWQLEWKEKKKRLKNKRRQAFEKNQIVTSPISAGETHFGIIDEEGKLKIVDLIRDSKPDIWTRTIKSKVVSVSCGYYLTGLVTEDGKAYIWGKVSHLLGKLSEDNSRPGFRTPTKKLEGQTTEVPELKLLSLSKPAKKISIRSTGLAIILNDLSVYYRTVNNSVEIPIKAIDISVSGVTEELAIVTQKNKLYKLHSNGKLEQIFINEQIKQVSLGYGHGAALSIRGNVYLWGHNRDGQLGFGHFNHVSSPTKISLPEPIVQVSCGGVYQSDTRGAITATVSRTGKVYVWGNNQGGKIVACEAARQIAGVRQLKNGTILIPFPIQIELDHPVNYITVGSILSLAVTNDGEVKVW